MHCVLHHAHGSFVSSTYVRSGTAGLDVEYEPATECGSQSLVRLLVPKVPADGLVFVVITRGYLDAVEIIDILPPPRGIQSSRDQVVFAFDCEPEAPAAISLQVQFERPGVILGQVGLEHGPTLDLSQWIAA